MISDPDPYRYHKVVMRVKSEMWTEGTGPSALLAHRLAVLLGRALASPDHDANVETAKIYIGKIYSELCSTLARL